MEPMASSSLLNLDGTDYVVSPEFASTILQNLGTLTFDTTVVEQRRVSLMNVSNVRTLTKAERSVLEALTHVKNVAKAIEVVGVHHDPIKDFGLDGWDAVHGNSHRAECGCVRHYVFDHHSATNHFGHNRMSDKRKHHEIAHHPCEVHA